VAYFELLSRYLPGRINLCQDIRPLHRESNQEPIEYKAQTSQVMSLISSIARILFVHPTKKLHYGSLKNVRSIRTSRSSQFNVGH
jgi:hypothetical protein